MPSNITQQLLNNITKYNSNPSSIQQVTLNALESVLKGDDIIDPTSPFIFLLEAASTLTAGAIAKSESVTRKLYPKIAQSQDELFHHMSDTDYVDIFATGANGTITFLIPYYQLLNNAVLIPNSNDVHSVVIPRNTQITVNNVTLDIGYPIVINVLPGNILQVYYDITINNPLFKISNNIINHNVINFNGGEYLQITVSAIQVASTSSIFSLSSTTSFSKPISFANQFCFARAYYSSGNGWIEMNTTYSPIVYDINKPTLFLSVDSGILTASLPDIYQTMKAAGYAIRVDVYNTLGVLNTDLSQITYNSFSATWDDFDTLNINPAVAPLNKINDIIIYSPDLLSGGSNAATLEQIRNRVVYHTDSTAVPIRISDVGIDLDSFGYAIETLIDSVTDKVFIASKNLPSRDVNGLASAPLSINGNIQIAVNSILNSGEYSISVLNQNHNRITISPNALFLVANGDAKLLSNNDINAINSLINVDNAQLCNVLNSGIYMYTPFHYIVDYNQAVVIGRPYYLLDPKITNRAAISANTARVFNIVTISAAVALIDMDYVITLTAIIPTGLSELLCQLTYKDPASGTTLYLNASDVQLQTTQAVITFKLNTFFDLNSFDQLEILNFFNNTNTDTPIYMDLISKFNIFYLVPGDSTGITTNFDNLYFVGQGMPSVIGASFETIEIEFGLALNGLYCPTSGLLAVGEYQKYPDDVIAVYTETIYESGPLGWVYTINTQGEIEFTVKHAVGDPVLDNFGNPIILHKAGDYVLDAMGKTIPTETYINSIQYSVGITMFDAKYKYATAGNVNGAIITGTTAEYTKEIPGIIVNYLTTNIAKMAASLNERTELWYKPMGNISNLQVAIGDGVKTHVPGILNPSIVFYLTAAGLENEDTISKIKSTTRSVISSQIAQTTITFDNLIEALKPKLPSDVVGFNVMEYLPNGVTVATMLNTTESFSIGEKLVVMPDGSLDITDTIQMLFYLAE